MRRTRAIRAALASLPPGLRRLCVAITVVLVACPLAIATLRASKFRASLEVFVLDQPPELPVRETPARYVERLVGTAVFERGAAEHSGLDIDASSLAKQLTIEPTERSVLVTAAASTPDDALALATALSGSLAAASAAVLGRRATAELAEIDQRLRDGALAVSERAALTRRAATLEHLAAAPPPQVAFGPPPSRPRVTALVDRAVDGLPGPMPANPGPARAGAAGLALALAICVGPILLWRIGAPRRAAGELLGPVREPTPARERTPRGEPASDVAPPLVLQGNRAPTESSRALVPTTRASADVPPSAPRAAAGGWLRVALLAVAGAGAVLFWRRRRA